MRGPGDAALIGAGADRNPPQGGGLGDHIVSRARDAGQQGLRRAAVAGEVPERSGFLFTRSFVAEKLQAAPVLSLVRL